MRADSGRGEKSSSRFWRPCAGSHLLQASAARIGARADSLQYRPPSRSQNQCSCMAARHSPAWNPSCSPLCKKSPAARRRQPDTAAVRPHRPTCFPRWSRLPRASRPRRRAPQYRVPRSWKRRGAKIRCCRVRVPGRPSCSRHAAILPPKSASTSRSRPQGAATDSPFRKRRGSSRESPLQERSRSPTVPPPPRAHRAAFWETSCAAHAPMR